jgi:hypothetical protein
MKTLRRDSVPAEVRTEHLPNSSVERYRCAMLLDALV